MMSLKCLLILVTFFMVGQSQGPPAICTPTPAPPPQCTTTPPPPPQCTTTPPPPPQCTTAPPPPKCTTTPAPQTTTTLAPKCQTATTETTTPTTTETTTPTTTETTTPTTTETTTPTTTTTTTTETTTPTPTDSPVTPAPPFECPKPFGSYPHEFSCIMYYQCRFDKPKLMKCPKDKYFNKAEGKCVGDQSSCEVNWRVVGCTRVGLFPVPDSCTDYYSCKEDLNGDFSRKKWSCLKDQYFNAELEACVPGDCPGEIELDEQ